MNKELIVKREKRRRPDGKLRDFMLIACLAFVLGIAAWKVFCTEEKSISVSETTAMEQKISGILEQIDGVGKTDVMICETEEGVQGVVVVCDGAKDFQVLILRLSSF